MISISILKSQNHSGPYVNILKWYWWLFICKTAFLYFFWRGRGKNEMCWAFELVHISIDTSNVHGYFLLFYFFTVKIISLCYIYIQYETLILKWIQYMLYTMWNNAAIIHFERESDRRPMCVFASMRMGEKKEERRQKILSIVCIYVWLYAKLHTRDNNFTLHPVWKYLSTYNFPSCFIFIKISLHSEKWNSLSEITRESEAEVQTRLWPERR